MNDIEKILKTALSPNRYPSEELNSRIVKELKESGSMKTGKRKFIMAAAIVMVILILPATVYAAYQYLMPKEAAKEMQDNRLSEAFKEDGREVLKTVTDGPYTVTYLGHVTGESISERTGSAWELFPDRMYVAVAVERTDGTAIKYGDGHSIFVTPLVQGLTPWKYNIVTMNGSYMEKIIDGVLYRITECDNIEVFADKKLYLAVSDTPFYSTEAFNYDGSTGEISENNAYKGTNVLFDMKLDSSKADAKKAEAYLKEFEKEWNSEAKSGDTDKSQEKTEADKNASEKNLRIQQEKFFDKENNITFQIKDNDSSSWWAGEDSSETAFSYYLKVAGEGIKSITYTLNKGEFGYYPKGKADEMKLYGKKCTVSYEEQKDRNFAYTIIITANFADYGYNADEIKKIGIEDLEKRNKIEYDVLSKEIEATKINAEIEMQDGRKIQKEISLTNVLKEKAQNIWIAMSVE